MEYTGEEKRKYPRKQIRFIVSYKLLEDKKIIDITQTKNISLGGMLLTTNKKFDPDTKLSLTVRLPFQNKTFSFVGRVVDSQEIIKDMIYDTRIEIISADPQDMQLFEDTLKIYSRRKEEK